MFFFHQSDLLPGPVHSVLRVLKETEDTYLFLRILAFSDGVIIFSTLDFLKVRAKCLGRKQKTIITTIFSEGGGNSGLYYAFSKYS